MTTASIITAILLTASPPSAGVVVWIGTDTHPLGLGEAAATEVLSSMGLQQRAAEDPRREREIAEALKAFQDGANTYWERGRAGAAVSLLESARKRLPPVVASPKHRRAVLNGLWLLSQLYIQGKRPKSDEAVAAIDHGLIIDPNAEPTVEEFAPKLLYLFSQRKRAFFDNSRRITVQLDKPQPSCRVWVDGASRGRLGRALGPFKVGPHQVEVRCGDAALRPNRLLGLMRATARRRRP